MPIYKSIADSVHKYIDIPKKIYVELIDTIQFQRLRRISQLAGVTVSYPSATHSRFAHSLGAFHIANRIMSHLRKLYPNDVSKEDNETVLISALIHDVGHGPFSHMFEDTIRMFCRSIEDKSCVKTFEPFIHHENITEEIILDPDSDISKVLEAYGYDKNAISELVLGKEKINKPFMNQIISSQIDADSLDYLMRDSLATGVSFGLYNLERLFAMIRLSEDGKLVVKEKALQSAEQVVIARYMQFSRVYFHKTVRCWEFMLKLYLSQLFKKLQEGKETMVLPFIKDFVDKPRWQTLIPLTDDVIYAQLELSASKEKNHTFLQTLAHQFLRRQLFKSIGITTEMAQEIENNREIVEEILHKHGWPEYAWGVDHFISRYYTPYDEINRDAILILTRKGEIKQLSEVSQVVASLSNPTHNHLLIVPANCRRDVIETLNINP